MKILTNLLLPLVDIFIGDLSFIFLFLLFFSFISWSCIYQWLKSKPNNNYCPVCKNVVTMDKLISIYTKNSSQNKYAFDYFSFDLFIYIVKLNLRIYLKDHIHKGKNGKIIDKIHLGMEILG